MTEPREPMEHPRAFRTAPMRDGVRYDDKGQPITLAEGHDHDGFVREGCKCACCRALAAIPETEDRGLRAVIEDGIEAFRLTREYVGEDTLPAIEGWSWFDWCEKARAALAPIPEDEDRLRAARALTVIYSHAPRVTDGSLVCAFGDFDGGTVFEAHVAEKFRAALASEQPGRVAGERTDGDL